MVKLTLTRYNSNSERVAQTTSDVETNADAPTMAAFYQTLLVGSTQFQNEVRHAEPGGYVAYYVFND